VRSTCPSFMPSISHTIAPGPACSDQGYGPAGCAQSMDVYVRCQGVSIADSVAQSKNPLSPAYAEDEIFGLSLPAENLRVVELMASNGGAHGKIRIFAFHFTDGISMALRSLRKAEHHRQKSDHGVGLALQNEFFSQVHQSSAFCVNGKTGATETL